MNKNHPERTTGTPVPKLLTVLTISVLVAGLNGCSFSPSINVLGSYFPAWIICCVAGIAVTAVAHYLFARWKLLDELWPLPILYPCLISFTACTLWLVFFR
ncbi:YtcA family lipoprotein [Terriglobus albidus]|uniref:YtcA family lipoprotein n=1 Tax=Terriglobus albidus TaxID=1592106 RepID=UPI0021E0AE27|nr:YtcA family lipoprotein [Terriglobus albidus]